LSEITKREEMLEKSCFFRQLHSEYCLTKSISEIHSTKTFEQKFPT